MSNSSDVLVPVVDWGLTFAEVPDKLALYFELGDCAKGCNGCHSPELQEPCDGISLAVLEKIAEKETERGANAICVLGGTECRSFQHGELVLFLQAMSRIAPTCLYSGSDDICRMQRLAEAGGCTWVKTGSYQAKLGGLQSPTTNQRFFKREQQQHIDFRERNYSIESYWLDMTEVFWKG